LLSSNSSGQISSTYYFNRQWISGDQPIDLEFETFSKVDPQKRIITAGTAVNQEEGLNFKISRHLATGMEEWSIEWDAGMFFDDYVTGLTVDVAGNIYVAGCSFNPQLGNFNYSLVKISNTGVLDFGIQYDSTGLQNDFSTDITIDDFGNIYLTGVSFATSTLNDFCTVKFNSMGSPLWEKRYDYNNFQEFPTKIEYKSNYLIVTSGSIEAFDDWDFTTLKYDLNGILLAERRTEDGVIPFDTPKDIAIDTFGNIFLTGQIEVNTNNTSIVTYKLDNDLNIVWSAEVDASSFSDSGISISLDNQGNATVLCMIGRNELVQNIMLLNYNPEGNLNWQKTLSNINIDDKSILPKHIKVYNGAIYIAGIHEVGDSEQVFLRKFSLSGEEIWTKYGDVFPFTDLISFQMISLDTFYISMIIEQNSQFQYVIEKYDAYERMKAVDYTLTDSIKHVKNEVLVSFDPNQLDSAFVNDKSRTFGKLQDILKPEALTVINQNLPIDLKDFVAIKIYPQLTPRNRFSLTRQGDTIPIPPFWANFIVVNQGSLINQEFIDNLRLSFPVVRKSNYNFVYELLDCTTEDYVTSTGNDNEFFWLEYSDLKFSDQGSVAPYWSEEFNGNIQLNDAWCKSTGKSHIKVGVFDSVVDIYHEDLSDPSNNVFVEGWDFFQNTPINDVSLIGNEDHGTSVAGIIGALRNNGIGISGIAGGDFQYFEANGYLASELEPTEIQKGVQIYNFMIGQSIFISTDVVAQAVNLAVTHDFEQEWGEAIHIMNHSWGTNGQVFGWPWRIGDIFDEEIALQFNFANRNGVVSIVARGNQNQDIVEYPACYYDDWTISVGASNASGSRASFSSFGKDMDIIAPGENLDNLNIEVDFIQTTDFDIGQLSPYRLFDGTSAAAPHVAGIASLMLSYYNDIIPVSTNLFPEDVENLVQLSASNSSDYTQQLGHGLLRGGRAIDFLSSPEYLLIHEELILDNSNLSPVSNEVVLRLPQAYEDLPPADYLVDIYTVEGTKNYTIPENYELNATWQRTSSATTFRQPFTQNNVTYLFPDQGCELISTGFGFATLRGYVYHILTTSEGEIIDRWLPEVPDSYTLPFTVHMENTIPIDVKDLENEFVVFPNPAISYIEISTLEFSSNHDLIEIYNSVGELAKRDVFQPKIDISELAKGFYVLVITSGTSQNTFKFVKQ